MRARRLAWSLLAFVALALPACGGGGLGGSLPGTGGGGGGGGGGTPPATMSAQELAYAQQVLALVNQERANQSIGPVTWYDAATDAAYAHAVDMDVRNFFAHDNPDGHDPGWRLAQAGVFPMTWGENIAMGQQTPQDVMTAWMNSSGHRANILNPSFHRLGIGVHIASGGPWWVQDFTD